MSEELEPLSGIDCWVNVINGLLILAALAICHAVAWLKTESHQP